ncbi:MAG: Lrp/AsnC family transcriptional regulator [Eubacteriales bacterium]|nr:Lrp/AsnC family transcriptional regulator [Eubacteriales bacterium]
MYIEGLDELDNKILEVIQENARLTYSEIGEQVGISRISVKKRMDHLEKMGIIQGYHTIINPTCVPDGVRFMIDIETTPESYEDVVEKLSREKYIRQIYGVSGECALHATGFVSHSRNLQLCMNALYATNPKNEPGWYAVRELFEKISC